MEAMQSNLHVKRRFEKSSQTTHSVRFPSPFTPYIPKTQIVRTTMYLSGISVYEATTWVSAMRNHVEAALLELLKKRVIMTQNVHMLAASIRVCCFFVGIGAL